MRKIAAITLALLILIPVSALFPFFGSSPSVKASPLFSRSYSNYTLSLGAPSVHTGQGDFKFIISDYKIKYPSGTVPLFDRIGLAGFADDRAPDDSDTSVKYTGTDVSFILHGIPTAAMAFNFASPNSMYFVLASGISALPTGDGMVLGNGKVSATIVAGGSGSLLIVGGGILATAGAGLHVVFRANPGSDSFVAQSVAFGKVGGEIFTTSSGTKLVDDDIAFADVSMGTVGATNTTYSASISGSLPAGKVFIIDVDRSILSQLDAKNMAVKLDKTSAGSAESLAAILWENGTAPKFMVAADGDWLQVYVYIPAMTGDHSITFEPQKAPIGAEEIASALAAVVLVCVAAVALYRRD